MARKRALSESPNDPPDADEHALAQPIFMDRSFHKINPKIDAGHSTLRDSVGDFHLADVMISGSGQVGSRPPLVRWFVSSNLR